MPERCIENMICKKFNEFARDFIEDGPYDTSDKLEKGYYVLAYQRMLETIAKDDEIKPIILRVFIYLLAKMDYNNKIKLQQVEIAEALEMAKSSVSNAINTLLNKGILLRDKNNRFYFLNQLFGWKGGVDKLNEVLTTDMIRQINKENARLEEEYKIAIIRESGIEQTVIENIEL